MTVYIGVDFHARKQTVSYLTTEDGEIKQTELQHDLEEMRGFYAELRKVGHVIVGFESSGYAAWFEEMLEELGCEIWIGHAAQIRKCARRRQKNDRRDAELILELMRNKLIQSAWVSIRQDPELREFYQRVYQRHPKKVAARKAIVAVARKLTTPIYAVLKEQRPFVLREISAAPLTTEETAGHRERLDGQQNEQSR